LAHARGTAPVISGAERKDADGHLWEVAFNPDLLPVD
jgi:hypothetical protein